MILDKIKVYKHYIFVGRNFDVEHKTCDLKLSDLKKTKKQKTNNNKEMIYWNKEMCLID